MTREDADAKTRPLCPVSGGPVTPAEGGTVKAMGDLGGGPGVVVVIRPRYRSQARCTCGWVGKTRLLLSSARVEALIHAAQTDCEPAIPLVQSWAVPIKPSPGRQSGGLRDELARISTQPPIPSRGRLAGVKMVRVARRRRHPLGPELVTQPGAGAPTWKGHALLLRARRSDFRFP